MDSTISDQDAALVERARAGEPAAWRALVVRFQRLIYTVVMRAGLDEHTAADVFQTVFVRLHDHLPRLSDPRRVQAWVVTTAKREAWLLRERSRRQVSISPVDDDDAGWDAPDDGPIPEDALADLQQLDHLRAAFDQLDGRCQTLLRAVFSDQDRPDYHDISQRLGLPVGSIGPTRGRCIDKLRRLMR